MNFSILNYLQPMTDNNSLYSFSDLISSQHLIVVFFVIKDNVDNIFYIYEALYHIQKVKEASYNGRMKDLSFFNFTKQFLDIKKSCLLTNGKNN